MQARMGKLGTRHPVAPIDVCLNPASLILVVFRPKSSNNPLLGGGGHLPLLDHLHELLADAVQLLVLAGQLFLLGDQRGQRLVGGGARRLGLLQLGAHLEPLGVEGRSVQVGLLGDASGVGLRGGVGGFQLGYLRSHLHLYRLPLPLLRLGPGLLLGQLLLELPPPVPRRVEILLQLHVLHVGLRELLLGLPYHVLLDLLAGLLPPLGLLPQRSDVLLPHPGHDALQFGRRLSRRLRLGLGHPEPVRHRPNFLAEILHLLVRLRQLRSDGRYDGILPRVLLLQLLPLSSVLGFDLIELSGQLLDLGHVLVLDALDVHVVPRLLGRELPRQGVDAVLELVAAGLGEQVELLLLLVGGALALASVVVFFVLVLVVLIVVVLVLGLRSGLDVLLDALLVLLLAIAAVRRPSLLLLLLLYFDGVGSDRLPVLDPFDLLRVRRLVPLLPVIDPRTQVRRQTLPQAVPPDGQQEILVGAVQNPLGLNEFSGLGQRFVGGG
mmetsp:Transcript_18017/g.33591  ORF Transcript_18017/g.33591 Transcript_18017/m.33591 type:complete len:494 (-) Transcript_18017:89-1570(-)